MRRRGSISFEPRRLGALIEMERVNGVLSKKPFVAMVLVDVFLIFLYFCAFVLCFEISLFLRYLLCFIFLYSCIVFCVSKFTVSFI